MTPVCELPAGTFQFSQLRLLDWSPDDKYIAYTQDKKVVICDGQSGKRLDVLSVGGNITFSNFVWLSSSAAIFCGKFNLFLFEKNGEHWAKTPLLTIKGAKSVSDFTRLSDRSVAWKQDGNLWMFQLGTEAPRLIWRRDKANTLVDFSYAYDTENLVLNCGTNGILEVSPFFRDPKPVDRGRIGRPDQYLFQVYSINGGKGYAYLSSDTSDKDVRPSSPSLNNTLYVVKEVGAPPVQVLGSFGVFDYAVNKNKLFIEGMRTNEPCGIWSYDVDSGDLTRIYSPLPSPQYARFATHRLCSTTNALGKTVNYHLWSPVEKSPRKKYPLIVCQTYYRWMPEAQAVANSGGYFAIAERPTFFSKESEDFSQDVLSVYRAVARSERIDSERVYLWGSSAEGSYVSQSMLEQPDVWKGAFLEGALGPTPELIKGPVSEFTIILGELDEDRVKLATKYVDDAARTGVPVRVVLRSGGHVTFATANQRVYAREMAKFLLRNQ